MFTAPAHWPETIEGENRGGEGERERERGRGREREREREKADSLVPVGLGVAVQRGEHDGQDPGRVVADQAHDVLVVPVVQRPLCHLQEQRPRSVAS